MTPRRVAAALTVATALAVAATVIAHDPPRPPDAAVTIRGLTATAATGSYCIPDPDGGNSEASANVCADVLYPLHPHGRLPAPPGTRARIDLKTTTRAVSARLVRRDGDDYEFVGPQLHGHATGDRKRVWRVRLPDHLHGAQILDVSVEYPDGEADFWVGIRPVSHWP